MGDSVEFRVKNSLDEIPRLAEAWEAFAAQRGIPARVVYHVNLVLDEVITNVISYGYPENGEHDVLVRVSLKGAQLMVTVVDGGRPFNPLDSPPPDLTAGVDDRPIGGLGVHFLRSFMDDVTYSRDGDHNRLSMRKQVDWN